MSSVVKGLVHAVAVFSEANIPEAKIGFRKFLFDHIGFDRHPDMVGLPCKIGRGMVILFVGFECAVAGVAPENSSHSQFMCLFEGFCYLYDLPVAFGTSKVNGGPHGYSAQIPCFLSHLRIDIWSYLFG